MIPVVISGIYHFVPDSEGPNKQIRIKKMRIPLEHLSKFYKELIRKADTDGKIFSFLKNSFTTIDDYIPSVGNHKFDDPFNNIKENNFHSFNGQQLISVIHELKNNRINIAPYERKLPSGKNTIDVGSICQQRNLTAKLNYLASLIKHNPDQSPIVYKNKIVTVDQLRNKISVYLDVLKNTPSGAELAYNWCKSQPNNIIELPPDILLKKAAINPLPTLTYSTACRRNSKQHKRNL
jgi:hypothetical protein